MHKLWWAIKTVCSLIWLRWLVEPLVGPPMPRDDKSPTDKTRTQD